MTQRFQRLNCALAQLAQSQANLDSGPSQARLRRRGFGVDRTFSRGWAPKPVTRATQPLLWPYLVQTAAAAKKMEGPAWELHNLSSAKRHRDNETESVVERKSVRSAIRK